MERREKPMVVSLSTHLLPAWISFYLRLFTEVILIEGPGINSVLRMISPRHNGVGFAHLLFTRGIEIRQLNLRESSERQKLLDLLADAAVLILGISPKTQARLHLEAEELAILFSHLLIVTIQAFPNSLRSGHDLSVAAASGILAAGNQPGEYPPLPPIQWIDILTTLWGVLAILKRLADGKPGILRVDMLSAAKSVLPILGLQLLRGEMGKLPLGGAWPCYNIYPTADGRWVALAALEPSLWDEFCQAVGAAHLKDHWTDPQAIEEVVSIFSSRELKDWLTFAEEHNVCLEPVAPSDEATGLRTDMNTGEVLELLASLLVPQFLG